MSRSERMFELLQLLRCYRYPVTGVDLAAKLDVSLRTLYRDIRSLQVQGAPIEGEAGLGYVLRAGFMLPPLMFTPDEIEALVLGVRWVSQRTDGELSDAARHALAKISSIITPELRYRLEESPLLIGPARQDQLYLSFILQIRRAIESEFKLIISYADKKQQSTERTIWPFAIGFFDDVRIILAWCELRNDIRHFRLDRVNQLQIIDETYPRRRQQLLNDWYRQNNISRQW